MNVHDWMHPLKRLEAKVDHIIAQNDALLAAIGNDPATIQAMTAKLKESSDALKAAIAAQPSP